MIAPVLILISAFAMALHMVWMTALMRRYPACTPAAASTVPLLGAFAFQLPVWLVLRSSHAAPSFSGLFFAYLAVTILLTLAARRLVLTAYAGMDVARASSFSALTPVLTVLAGWVFLWEAPDGMALFGIVLTSAAIYLLFLGPRGGGDLGAYLVGPFAAVARSRAALGALVGAALPAVSLVFQKRAVLQVDALTYSLLAAAGVGLAGIGHLLPRRSAGADGSSERTLYLWLFASGALIAVTQIASSAALRFELTANVAGLSRISILFQILFGYWLLGERNDLVKKSVLAVALVAGTCAISSRAVEERGAVGRRSKVPLVVSSRTTAISRSGLRWLAAPDRAKREWKGPLPYAETARVLRTIASSLPHAGRIPRYATCAVVGNSGNLRGSGYGPLIDSHDAVFRMTKAPRAGFEADVGHRSTYHFLSSLVFNPRNFDPNATILFYETEISRLRKFAVFADERSREVHASGEVASYFQNMNHIPPENFRVVHPDFMAYVANSCLAGRAELPSTGLLAIFFALEVCDSVDLFGYGANADGNWDHYYDPAVVARKAWVPHNFDAEKEIRDDLANDGSVRIFSGVR